ncbi:PstS family phosphate ABC transporter substrate-binding protein, partial [Mycobacterium tuberculosis]
MAQLDAVFSAERRRGGIAVKTWGDLGLEGAWANRPLHRYGMVARRASGNPPGVVNFIQRRVLLDGPFRGDIAEQVDRAGEQALAAIVRRVGEDVDGIGYSGFGYASGSVRAVPLAEHAGASFVAGTPESVADRRYPLGRRIYIMIDRAPGRPLDPAL